VATNRISGYSGSAADSTFLPPGFAVSPFGSTNPLTLQLLAQQQAYEQALVLAREEALRIALSRLQPSVN
jgi:hypothetical protein